MKRFICFTSIIVLAVLGCRKQAIVPVPKPDLGSIDARLNGRAWLNDQTETVQVTYGFGIEEFRRNYPCAKDWLSLRVGTFSKPDGYRRVYCSFTVPAKPGEYFIRSNQTRDPCLMLNTGNILNFSGADGDAALSTYTMYDEVTNKVTITDYDPVRGLVSGNFTVSYVKNAGFNYELLPDTVQVSCNRFVAVAVKD